MKKTFIFALALISSASLVHSAETRHVEAHMHGVGHLDIAIEDNIVTMVFKAPGADIVGFEYEAESEADKQAVKAAMDTLKQPLSLFSFPEKAGCSVQKADVELIHHHDEHEEHHNDEHEEHYGDEGHNASDFVAHYQLTCKNTSAINSLSFGYFEQFPAAEEVEVQIVGDVITLSTEATKEKTKIDF